MQRTAFEKDRRSYAGSIMNTVALDIKYQPLQVFLSFIAARVAGLPGV